MDPRATSTVFFEPLTGVSAINDYLPLVKQAGGTKFILPSQPAEDGDQFYPPTSGRAKLQAVIYALDERPWTAEGFTMLVVGTDLEYISKGMSEWVWIWRANGWKTKKGRTPANIDLWERLVDRVFALKAEGLRVKFWKVPRIKGPLRG